MNRRLLAAALVATSALALLPAVPTAAAASPTVTMTVAPRGGGVIGPGDLDVDVTVANTGSTPLPAGELAFSMDQAPAASATAVLAAIAKPSTQLLGRLITGTRKRTPALAPGTSTTVHASIDRSEIRTILSSASGARLLYVRLRAGSAPEIVEQIAESTVVRMGKDVRARIGFGTVIPLVAPRNATGVVDVDEQAALTAPGGAWTDALEAARAMPAATLALDPEVVASIRLAGATAPASATAFLGALAGLPNTVLKLPYGDQDVTMEQAAGAAAPPGPGSFAGSTTEALTPDVATPTPSPTPQPEAAEPAAELTDWRWSTQRVVWPVPGTTTTGFLSAAGGDVLLGSSDVADTVQRASAGPAARIGAARALIVDRQASALLAAASAGGPTGNAAVAPLVAVLATDLVSGTAPTVLTSVGRGAQMRALPGVLALLDSLSWVDGRSTAQLAAASSPVAVKLHSGVVPAQRVAVATDLLQAERGVRDLGRAMKDPGAVTGPSRLALLALLSAAWRGQDAAWVAAASGAEVAFRGVVAKVHIAPGDRATPVGSDGSLQVVVQNELPEAVTVDVGATVSNGRLRFTANRPRRVTVPASTGKRVTLPYRAITNGPTTVTLTLTTPQGAALGSSSRAVTVRAGFDTVVAVVLLTALGLLLALGVYRNVRRRSRPRMATA